MAWVLSWPGRAGPRRDGAGLLKVAPLGETFTGSRVIMKRSRLGRPAATAAPQHGDDLARFAIPAARAKGTGTLAVARAVIFALYMYFLGFFFFFPAIVITWPLVKKLDPSRRRLIDYFIKKWSHFLTWPFFRVKVEGRENLPPDGSYVIVANHQSFMDILSSFHLGRSFKFLSKASILKIPIIGWAMMAADHVTIEREDRRSQMKAFRACLDKLESGSPVFVFPEGTRSQDGRLLEFKKGPVAMAKRAGVPLVPVTILGTSRLMPNKREYMMYWSPPGVRIIIHQPITAEEVKATNDEDLLASCRRSIESSLPEHLRMGKVA